MNKADLLAVKDRLVLLGEATKQLIKLYTYKNLTIFECNIDKDFVQEAIAVCKEQYFSRGEAQELLNDIRRVYPEIDDNFGKVKFSDTKREWYIE